MHETLIEKKQAHNTAKKLIEHKDKIKEFLQQNGYTEADVWKTWAPCGTAKGMWMKGGDPN